MEKTVFEQMGGTYREEKAYLIPNLTLSKAKQVEIGVWGQKRLKYLKTHHKILYYNLLTSGKLYEHLAEIDTSACNMAEYLIKEMARRQGVTEQLKAVDMMRWIGLMNNIRACVDEIVLNDIVYNGYARAPFRI